MPPARPRLRKERGATNGGPRPDAQALLSKCGFALLKRLTSLPFEEVRMHWTVALAALCVAAACAAADQPGSQAPTADRDCFNVSMVTGYETIDDDTLRLDAGPSRTYKIDLSGGQCRNVDWPQRLAIESSPSSSLCVGSQPGQGNIHFREPATQRRASCYIDEVRRVQTPGS